MRPFRDLPIQRQLAFVIMVTCSLALLIVCAALASYEVLASRTILTRNLSALTDILSTNCQAALSFDDADAAKGILSALSSEPHVIAARVFNHEGEPFAEYLRSGSLEKLPPSPDGATNRFEGGRFVIERSIERDGKRLGAIFIESDLGEIHDRMTLFIGVSVLVALGTILLAAVTSARLQRLIAHPILVLSDIAKRVAEQKDFTLRAPHAGDNELGALTESFNHMLSQIHDQNRALREGEVRMRTVLDSALCAVVVTDENGLITDWSARASGIFGHHRTAALGHEVAATVFLDCAGKPQTGGFPIGEDELEGGKTREVVAKRVDGSTFPAELSVSRLIGDGKTSFCGFITDITERKLTEVKIQAQLSRLDLLQRITHAIGERQDLDSIFQVVVRSLEDHLSIDFSCMCLYDHISKALVVNNIGVNSRQLAMGLALPERSVIHVGQNGLSRCVDGKLVYEPDVSVTHSDFTQRLANGGLRALVAAPLVVEGRIFGVLLVARRLAESFSSAECEFLRQLTEHVALAAHQTQLHLDLQRAYDDLRQTQQAVMQQERLRALGQMASGIAHDINNAISPVALYTQSLLEREPNLSDRARGYLETIERAIDDVATTVSRMREFYRQRETQLELAPVQLNQLVKQVIDLTRARWSDMPMQLGHVISLVSDLSPSLPVIMGSEGEIREALTNLIFNAVDAMPGGGTLTLRTRSFLKETGAESGDPVRCVRIEVCDTGIGMDEDTRRRCLEPFFTTKGERGTGLGLAMVYGMIQRHSADIDIVSAVGQGTMVCISFIAPESTVLQPPAEKMAANSQKLRLLIVDDDPILLKSLSDTLTEEGHSVFTANGGRTGIEAFKEALSAGKPFSLVITDLGMPYVDGRKVASAIKEMERSTPVIMLTGWGQRLLSDGDIPPHVDRVLSKPPKLHELRKAFMDLERNRSRATQP